MSRQTRKQLPLELRWRAVTGLPEEDKEVEIAFVRFLDDSTRVGVARMTQDTYTVHRLTDTIVPTTIHGWGVLVNGENLTPEPLAFLDALHQGWSVFVEAIPRMAQALTRETNLRARHEGWRDDVEMEVRVEYAQQGFVPTTAGGTVEVAHPPADAGGA